MNFKEEWKVIELGEIAEVVMGQSPFGSSCNQNGEGQPLLNGPTEFGSQFPTPVQFTTDPKKISKKGDLLFCVRGSTTGRMNWADQDYVIGRGLAAIRHKKSPELQQFIKALIEYNLSSLLAEATGSTFPNISSQQLKALKVKVPNIEAQQKIASILFSLDKKIDTNRQMNQTLEDMAQALFREMCLPKGDELQEGWEWKKLGDLSFNKKKVANPSQLSIDTNYIGLEHMPRKKISLEEWGSTENVSSNKYKFEKNDILFGKLRPYFHKVGIAPVDGVCSTDILVISPKKSSYLGFLLIIYSSEELISHANNTSGGTRMPRTSWKDLQSYKVILPPIDTLRVFNQQIICMLEKIIQNIFENKVLIETRDILLPKLMRGEIEV